MMFILDGYFPYKPTTKKMLHLPINLLFMVVMLSSLVAGAIETEDLGVRTFKNGLIGRMYKSTLTGSEEHFQKANYLENMQYLKDGELIAQRVITDFTAEFVKNKTNELFGFYYDPDYSEIIVELRGYIKAPKAGNPDINIGLWSVRDCDDNHVYQSETDYWVLNGGLYINITDDGHSICTYDTTLPLNDHTSGYTNTFDTAIGTSSRMNLDWVQGQYYPVVFRSLISADALKNNWNVEMNSMRYYLDSIAFYDPQDDATANDANGLAQFPANCPQYQEDIFTETTFITPTSTVPNGCVSSTSSIVTSLPTSSAKLSVITSSAASSSESTIVVSSSVVSSSTEPSTVVTSSTEASTVESSLLGSSSTTSSSIDSTTIISSATKSTSLVSSTGEPMSSTLSISSSVSSSDFSSYIVSSLTAESSFIESNNPVTSSGKVTSIVSSSQYLSSSDQPIPSTSSLSESQYSDSKIPSSIVSSIHSSIDSVESSSIKSSVTSTVTTSFTHSGSTTVINVSNTTGPPVFPTNNIPSSPQSNISTSRTSAIFVPSSFGNSKSHNFLSTTTLTISGIETDRTTTCPDLDSKLSTGVRYSTDSKTESIKSAETTKSRSQGPTRVVNVKTTLNANGETITYITSGTIKAGRDIHSSNTIPTTTKEQVSQRKSGNSMASSTSNVQPHEVYSTTALIQSFSDEGGISTYNSLLFVLSFFLLVNI